MKYNLSKYIILYAGNVGNVGNAENAGKGKKLFNSGSSSAKDEQMNADKSI